VHRKIQRKFNLKTGVLSGGNLAYVIKRPTLRVYGNEVYPDVYSRAAALMEGLLRRHVFSDGNKRTALLAMQFYFKKNKHAFFLPLSAVRFSVVIADSSLDDQEYNNQLILEISEWLKIYASPISDLRKIFDIYRRIKDEIDMLLKLYVTNPTLGKQKFEEALAIDIYPTNSENKYQIMEFVDESNANIMSFINKYSKGHGLS